MVCLTIWSLLRLAASGFSNSFPCAVSYGLVKKRIITRVWTRSVEGNESWAKFTKLTPFVVEGKKREGRDVGFLALFGRRRWWWCIVVSSHFFLGICLLTQSVSQSVRQSQIRQLPAMPPIRSHCVKAETLTQSVRERRNAGFRAICLHDGWRWWEWE